MKAQRSPRLPRAIELAHELVLDRLAKGDHALDATVGNGHDTTFLANCVGPEGIVYGFDIQKSAILSTREKAAGLSQVELHHRGHEELAEVVEGPLKAVMFNLGYLPSGDKAVTTQPASTISALDSATCLLSPGGIITVVVYPGHPGGEKEASVVEEWCRALSQEQFAVVRYGFLNQRNSPPFLIAVERRPENE